MKVNGQDAEPGCYIDGHWGQYGMDRVADVAEQFDIGLPADPRHWRCVYDDPENYREENSTMTSGDIFEQIVYCSDLCVDRLNEVTEGGYWSWEDGEFFLTQTEANGRIYVIADDYEQAWEYLRDGVEGACYADRYQACELAEDADEDLHVYEFQATYFYIPDGMDGIDPRKGVKP